MTWVWGVKKKKTKKKTILFSYIFYLHTVWFTSTARKKEERFQCLHAQVALVLQPALYLKKTQTNKTKQKKPVKLEEKCKHGANHVLGSVFTVKHTQFGIDAPSACCSSIRFSISINISHPSTLKDVKDARQQHLHVSHVFAHWVGVPNNFSSISCL